MLDAFCRAPGPLELFFFFYAYGVPPHPWALGYVPTLTPVYGFVTTHTLILGRGKWCFWVTRPRQPHCHFVCSATLSIVITVGGVMRKGKLL